MERREATRAHQRQKKGKTRKHTDRAANGNHLQMPPLQLPREPRVRRLQRRLVDIVVPQAVVLCPPGLGPDGGLVFGIEGRHAAAGVAAEAVEDARGNTVGGLVIVDRLAHGVAAALGYRVLPGLDGRHLDDRHASVGGHGACGVGIRG